MDVTRVEEAITLNAEKEKEFVRNRIEKQINEQINIKKEIIAKSINEYILSDDGKDKKFPIDKIKAFRKKIINMFVDVKTNLPSFVYNDIEHGWNTGLGGIKDILVECQKNLTDAETECTSIKEIYDEYEEWIKSIKSQK